MYQLLRPQAMLLRAVLVIFGDAVTLLCLHMQFFKMPLEEHPYFRHQLGCASLLCVIM